MQKSQQRSWFSFFLTNQSKRILRFKLLYCTKFDRFILSFDQDSIIGLSCHSALDDSPVEDDEHDGNHVAADLLHHQVDLVTLPLLLLTTGAATLLEDWSKLFTSQLSNHKQTQNGCPSFYFAIFSPFCELVCRDPPKNLIHIMQVILIG